MGSPLRPSWESDVDEPERFFAVSGVDGRGDTSEARDWPEFDLLNGRIPPTPPPEPEPEPEPFGFGEPGTRS